MIGRFREYSVGALAFATILLAVGFVLGAVTMSDTGLNMGNAPITNIGAAGTDFTSTGGLDLADRLNITSGSLWLGGNPTYIRGNDMNNSIRFSSTQLVIYTSDTDGSQKARITIPEGSDVAMDLGNNYWTNIGASGTDFDSDGGLTLASDLVLSTGCSGNCVTGTLSWNTTHICVCTTTNTWETAAIS